MTLEDKYKLIKAFVGYKESTNVPYDVFTPKYDTDWNDMHNVLAKIASVTINRYTPFITLTNYGCKIEIDTHMIFPETQTEPTKKMVKGVNINKVFDIVVQFILYYNENKRDNE